MKKIWLASFSAAIMFLGCNTTPPPPPVDEPVEIDAAQDSLDAVSDSLNNIKNLIADASPESLTAAIVELESSGMVDSEYGRDLAYICQEILSILYPLIVEDDQRGKYTAGNNSRYPDLFETVRRGQLPDISGDDTEFQTLLIASLTLLFTDDDSLFSDVQTLLDSIRQIHSGSLLPVYLSGVMAEARKEYEEAVRQYQAARNLSPQCYPARIGLVRMYLVLEEPQSAWEYLDPLLVLYGTEKELQILEARTQFERGNIEEATELTQNLLSDDRENAELLFLLARIRQSSGNLELSLTLLENIADQFEGDPFFVLVHAEILYSLGDLTGARSLLLPYADNPAYNQINTLYGKILLELGEEQEGVEILEGSLDLNPENTENLLSLLENAESSRNWPKAREYIDRLLKEERRVEYLRRACAIYAALDDNGTVLKLSYELYLADNRDPLNVYPYLDSLSIAGENFRALEVIDTVLPIFSSPAVRSDLFYRKGLMLEDSVEKKATFMSSWFEKPSVETALELADIQNAEGDKKGAVRFLDLAIPSFPDDDRLQKKLEEIQGD